MPGSGESRPRAGSRGSRSSSRDAQRPAPRRGGVRERAGPGGAAGGVPLRDRPERAADGVRRGRGGRTESGARGGLRPGELAARIQDELGADVVAVDISPRMVELARGRGVDARVGDAQELPFAPGEFDCAVAAWMLYHIPDPDRALAELARVLERGGRLVAVTNAPDHLRELRALLGLPTNRAGHP